MIVAHGIIGRGDVPISRQLFVTNGALVVVASFVILAGFWQQSRLRGNAAGVGLPTWVQAVVDSSVTRLLVRLVVLALSVFVVIVAAFGPSSSDHNIAPYILFIQFWVGLVPASLLFGPVWRTVNPLRTLHRGWARLAGVSPSTGFRQLPERIGCWPAVVTLFAFVLFELVIPNHAEPFHVAVFLIAYGMVVLGGAFVYGEEWFARADAFEVYSTLIGRMAFLGRRDDGRLVVRSPFNSLDGLACLPGMVAFIITSLGSTGFDGLERTSWWGRNFAGSVWLGTLGLLIVIAAVGVLYLGATAAAAKLGHTSVNMGAALAHSLIPIAVGYAVAHYFSLLVFDGQKTYSLASDPFGNGSNWFGTAKELPDYTVLSLPVVSGIRAAGIVIGHVLGTIAAHDRVLRLLPPRLATRAQLPLLLLMVLFTMCGLLLILA